MTTSVKFRVPGIVPNLKNEHVPAERWVTRRNGQRVKTPFIRRTKELSDWMTKTKAGFKRQLETQLPSDAPKYPIAKKPFEIHVVFWLHRPYSSKDRDGQLATLLDTLQGVVFTNDAYLVNATIATGLVPVAGMDFADIVVRFREDLCSVQELRAVVPELYPDKYHKEALSDPVESQDAVPQTKEKEGAHGEA